MVWYVLTGVELSPSDGVNVLRWIGKPPWHNLLPSCIGGFQRLSWVSAWAPWTTALVNCPPARKLFSVGTVVYVVFDDCIEGESMVEVNLDPPDALA